MAYDSYGRPDRADLERGYRRGDFMGSRDRATSEGYRGVDINDPNDKYGGSGLASQRPAGPGGYAPFGAGLYGAGGGTAGGAYPMTPGYMDWGDAHAGRGSGTTPGGEGFGRPGADTWGEAEYRREARSFAGRGPKNYRRADERIHEDVCEALTHDPEVDATGIEISVADGEVTLSGTVDDRYQRRRAEDVVERISGVRDVHNRLRTEPTGEKFAS